MAVNFSAALPPTRATGDSGPAADMNLLRAALIELRTAVTGLAGGTVVDTSAPTISAFTATPGAAQVALAWAAVDDVAVTNCTITRGGTIRYQGNARSFTETGLTNGTSYSWTLTVYDAAGNTRTATVTSTPVATATLAKIAIATPTVSGAAATCAYTVTLGTDGVIPDSATVGRDGTDTAGSGVYTTTVSLPTTASSYPYSFTVTYDKLIPGSTVNFPAQLLEAGANYGAAATASASIPAAASGGSTGDTTSLVPNGPSGSWTLVWHDEFDGTSLDTSRWSKMDGGFMNKVTTRASNISVANSCVILQLSDASNGAEISSGAGDGAGANAYLLQVGDYVEASVYFPGGPNGLYNWPAFWTSGSPWPAAGEHDIAEVLGGKLTAGNYHYGTSASPQTNNGPAPTGSWANGFHTYGLYRKASSAEVYWDGTLVRSYSTSDNGGGQSILANIGVSADGQADGTGAAYAIKVDYVRVWRPAAATGTTSSFAGTRSKLPWNSGAFVAFDSSVITPYEQGRGRKLDNISTFTTRDTVDTNVDTSYLSHASAVTGNGGWLTVGVPLWANNQSASSDITAMFQGIGQALNASGFASRIIVRLGWEMNLSSWPHNLNGSNQTQWIAQFKKAVGLLRQYAPGIKVAFNPNEGGMQTSGSVDLGSVATQLLSYYEFCGPDVYNWYPIVNDASGWSSHYNASFGIKYWEDFARANNKGYIVPEWGGYPGSSAGQGSDGSYYAQQMIARFAALAASGMQVVESHFNEPASYIADSLWDPQQMPAMATAVKNALAAQPTLT